MNHIVSSIVKELAEDRKFCHKVSVMSMAVINLLMLRNMSVCFQAQVIYFHYGSINIGLLLLFFSVSRPRIEIRYLDSFNTKQSKR